jgi:hypothetical protein
MLPAPASLTRLRLDVGDGDLAAVQALTGLTQLTLEGADGALDAVDLTVLARVPTLRTLTTRLRFDVGPLARAMGDRPVMLNGPAPENGLAVTMN